jgi:hypothetical protein
VTIVPVSDRREFLRAREEIARRIAADEKVIAVLTAEQANKAQKVVREAGRRGHR